MYTLIKGDCLEQMAKLEPGSVDLVLTDPPYNVSMKNNFGTMGRRGTDFGDWDKGFDLCAWVHPAVLTLSPDGSLIVFNTHQNLAIIENELKSVGFVYKDLLVMHKSNPMPRNRDRRYINAVELAVWFTRKKAKWVFNRQKDTYDSCVIQTSIVAGKERTKHPTQKPLSVMRDLILRHTAPGQTIFDPFMGSGSTGVAAMNTGRKFIGIEQEEEYFKIAEERILEAYINTMKGAAE